MGHRGPCWPEQQQMAKLMGSDIEPNSGLTKDMTPEEHRRRGYAADALFQDMKRTIAEQKPSG